MDEVPEVSVDRGIGIDGNADRGGRRQVTLLEHELWRQLTRQAGREIDPVHRRANVLVESFPLQGSRGRRLEIGAVVLEIRGETKPCERMDEALDGLKDVMWPDWGGGAYAEVVQGGTIRTGDLLRWAD
jgi:MOSC domain-containing protein YiiM